MRTQGFHSALWAHGSTKMQWEAFLSYCVWRTEVFNSCGFFLVPTPGKKTTQNTFSLQNSHKSESQRTHLGYISKKCQCQNSLLWRLLPWQSIDNFLEPESPPGAGAIYHIISLSANFECFSIIEFSTSAWLEWKDTGALTSRSLHCSCLLWPQHELGGFSKVLHNLEFHLLFIHIKISKFEVPAAG